ncbi:Alpha/Beta hydrolase protein [Paraphysoderma sedebokerense]|nr:Alpha/Beta hydrolase protein [Paraphysoderma sedebokerense]
MIPHANSSAKELWKAKLKSRGLPTQFDPESHDSAGTVAIGSGGNKADPVCEVNSSGLKKYSPLGWNECFDEMLDLKVKDVGSGSDDTFRVYRSRVHYSPSQSQVQSPSSSSNLPASTTKLPTTLFLLHHGGGQAALSWGVMSKNMKRLIQSAPAGMGMGLGIGVPKFGFVTEERLIEIVSFDMRGHGSTKTADELNLSLKALTDDCVSVLKTLYRSENGTNQTGWPEEIVLVGHSLGGAVLSHIASQSLIPNVLGIAVLDVVEGTALDALSGMNRYLSTRPEEFNRIEEGIEWCVRSGMVRNVESARVSVPPQLKLTKNGKYTWRTNLMATKPHWEDWFTSLTANFLSVPGSKLLILAHTDRLDKSLTIAQMQGKFQMVVVNSGGHNVQEDESEKVADVLVEFWKRGRRIPPKLKK